MPVLLAVIVIIVAYLVITAVMTAISQWSGEGRRRLARSYGSGYALAPSGTRSGDVVERDRLIICRDPIVLPAWHDDDEVVRVTGVKGVQAHRRHGGWWWTGTSFQVVELLPYWVVLGPAGRLALDVISSLHHLRERAPVGARPTIDPMVMPRVTDGDEWRSSVATQVRTATETLMRHLVVQELVDPERGELSDEESAALNAEFGRRVDSWVGTVEIVSSAALAAALIDELDADAVEALTHDWWLLLGTEEPPPRDPPTSVRRIVSWVTVVRREAARHPALTAVWTTMAFAPGLAIEPTVTVILYLAFVVAAAGVVLARRVRRTRRVRQRRWTPRGDMDHASPSASLIRRLMSMSVEGRSLMAARRLDMVLNDAEVWVALDGPAPDDASRTLRWISESGQRPPVLLGSVGGRSFALAFTDASRHGHTPVSWTARCRFDDLARYLRAARIDAVVIDPGHEPSVEIELGRSGTSDDQALDR